MMTPMFEIMEKSEGKMAVKIKLNDGRAYVLVFMDAATLKDEIKSEEERVVAVPGLIPIDVVNMSRVKQVIGHIYNSGLFDRLTPIEGGRRGE